METTPLLYDYPSIFGCLWWRKILAINTKKITNKPITNRKISQRLTYKNSLKQIKKEVNQARLDQLKIAKRAPVTAGTGATW